MIFTALDGLPEVAEGGSQVSGVLPVVAEDDTRIRVVEGRAELRE